MSERNPFFVKKELDSKLISDFKEFYIEFENHIFQVNIQLRTGDQIIGSRNDGALINLFENNLLKMLTESPKYLIHTIQVTLQNFTIIFKRGEISENPSSLFDCFQTSNSGDTGKTTVNVTPQLKIQMLKFLQDRLCPISTLQQISASVPKEYEALASLHSATLSKLEDVNVNLTLKYHDNQHKLEQDYLEKNKVLEEKYQYKVDELILNAKKEKESLYADIAVEKEALINKTSELELRANKLDDRDNTHVRREIRDKMLEDVKNRVKEFGVSSGTNRKRYPVYLGILVLILTFICFIVFETTLNSFSADSNIVYLRFVKISLYTIGVAVLFNVVSPAKLI